MYATGVNDTGGNMYIYYVCTGVRCKVCDERARGRGDGVSMSAAVKVKSLNPFEEGEVNQ